MMVGQDQLPLEALIFVREPCGLFRREILVHFQKVTSTGGFMPSFLSFIEAMLRPAQIQLSGVYDPNFFSGPFLHAFFSVESWMVSDHMLPANVPLATFHVYCLISCLQTFAGHPLLLPAVGLSLLEAKQIGILTYSIFAMMDLMDDGQFSDIKFAASILGLRLKTWSTLPDSAIIRGLWNKAPLQATYQWFASLQALLNIEQQHWVKSLRYHPERGFYHARDGEGKRYLLLDNQVPSNIPGRTDSLIAALRQFDTTFETRWFCSSFLDPIWSASILPGHTVVATKPTQKHTIQETQHEVGDYNQSKRVKLGGERLTAPDFISSTPLMETVLPFPPNTRSTTVPFPCLQAQNGTLQTVCFNSAFLQPHNCCILRLCRDKKAVPRTPRLHTNLYKEPW